MCNLQQILPVLFAGYLLTACNSAPPTNELAPPHGDGERLINSDFVFGANPQGHGGDDGVLGVPGARFWNVVPAYLPAATGWDLKTATGASTAVGIRRLPAGRGKGGYTQYRDLTELNALQSSGFGGGPRSSTDFQIQGLTEGEDYDLAVYVSRDPKRQHARTRVEVRHDGGVATTAQEAPPTFQLPGVEGADYLIFEALRPSDLEGGKHGFVVTVTTSDAETSTGGVPESAAVVAGLQIRGRF